VVLPLSVVVLVKRGANLTALIAWREGRGVPLAKTEWAIARGMRSDSLCIAILHALAPVSHLPHSAPAHLIHRSGGFEA
jgi:hypothetical protein